MIRESDIAELHDGLREARYVTVYWRIAQLMHRVRQGRHRLRHLA